MAGRHPGIPHLTPTLSAPRGGEGILGPRLCLALALAALAACSKPPSDAGLAVHQTVVIAAAGTDGERRLQVLEDERITPALRELMWGGSKDPAWLLAQPGVDASPGLAASLESQPFRRGLLRLVDRAGTVLAERRLDCELGEVAEPPLPQGDGAVWGVGDDCSTGGGDFAGLVTRFLVPGGDRIRFETCREPGDGRTLELTLVTARRIRWHLVPLGRAEAVQEVSSHPDFDGEAAAPERRPWVTELITYRWDGSIWTKAARVDQRPWTADEPWPEPGQFP